jgi:phasin family protein
MATKAKVQPKKAAARKAAPVLVEATTTKAAAHDGAATLKAAVSAAQTKFNSAGEKMQTQVQDMMAIAKGNYAAAVEATTAAKKGFETLSKVAADFTKTTVADAQANMKTLSAVKTPKEFFDVQTSVMKSSYEKFVGEMSKFTELYMKVAGDVTAPMSNRAAVVMDTVTKKAA